MGQATKWEMILVIEVSEKDLACRIGAVYVYIHIYRNTFFTLLITLKTNSSIDIDFSH